MNKKWVMSTHGTLLTHNPVSAQKDGFQLENSWSQKCLDKDQGKQADFDGHSHKPHTVFRSWVVERI